MTKSNFGSINDYKDKISIISHLTKKIRNLRPEVKTTWQEPADWIVKDSNIHGRPSRTLTITLTPTGCEWARSGGCTMCGEFEGSTKGDIVSAEFHVAQFASGISKYVSKYNPSWIRIYQEGNYLNEKEIENPAQKTILGLASLIRGVRRITIESMAKYLTRKGVQKLSEAVSRDVELEVGIGFESENDVVRNVCVNKGESIKDFRNAIKIIKEEGLRSVAYVLLKPPFLSEREAIEDAIETINVANELGFDAISLEPVSIHGYSLVHALSLAGFYELPWLWSVVKVVQSVPQIRDFRIGGVGFYPRPVNVAHNRHLNSKNDCNKDLWDAIKKYGKFRSFEVFDKLDCECKKEWEKVLQRPEKPLHERIDHQLSQLDFDHYAQIVSKNNVVRQPVVGHTTAVAGGTQFK